MKSENIIALKKTLEETVRRFPLSVLCSVLFTLIALYSSNHHSVRYEQELILLFSSCFILIAVSLWNERRNSTFFIPSLIAIAGLALLALVMPHNMTARVFLALAAFLSLFVAPYIHSCDNNRFWAFTYHTLLRIFFTLLAAITLFTGLAAILASISFLFGTQFNKAYTHLWIIIACLFSPLFAMAGIPRDFDRIEKEFPRFLKILQCNIAIPLWVVYALVLYCYILKILLAQSLPHGAVALMVAIFAAKGVGIYLIGYPLHQQEKGIAAWFNRYFGLLLLPPLLLLAVAVTVRIQQYGVTEERYTIVLGGVWLVFILLAKWRAGAQLPRLIFISAILLLLITSFGPWGVSGWSLQSQTSRLEAVLARNGMLENGKIRPPVTAVSFADRKSISSITRYLVQAGQYDMLIARLPAGALTTQEINEIQECFSHNDGQTLVKAMGIGYVSDYQTERDVADQEKSFSYSTSSYDMNKEGYNVSGYDYVAQIDYTDSGDRKIVSEPRKPPVTVSVKLNAAANAIEIHNKTTGNTLSVDVSGLFTREQWQNEKGKLKQLVAEGENSELKVKLLPWSASGEFTPKGLKLFSLNGIILLKVKP